jgi:hypothetical protein
MIMITGINRILEHDGRKFHIQCEDLGDEVGAYEIRVYDAGTVLWLKRLSYMDLVEKKLPQHEHEHELRIQMDKTMKTVEAAIVKGKIS